MIVDASALLAILLDEPDAAKFNRAIADELEDMLISPINFVEAAVRADQRGEQTSNALDEIITVRADQRGEQTSNALDEIIKVSGIKIAAVTAHQTRLARQAYQRFGKGNHPAKLNLGDCFAYALSKARGEPLLFKGDDFRLTDVEAAV